MSRDWWDQEYAQSKDLPSSRTDHPSRSLKWFIDDYSAQTSIRPGLAWDVGCGTGRNSFYLAQNSYSVYATDFSPVAIKLAQDKCHALNLDQALSFHLHSADDLLPQPDSHFDLILDMMVLHLLSSKDRMTYVQEVQRVLKPGGFYLFYTIFAGSPAAEVLFKAHPGPEPHSYIIPQSGIFEKAFTHQELLSLYPKLSPLVLENKTEFPQAFGDRYERMYIHGLFQKPS